MAVHRNAGKCAFSSERAIRLRHPQIVRRADVRKGLCFKSCHVVRCATSPVFWCPPSRAHGLESRLGRSFPGP